MSLPPLKIKIGADTVDLEKSVADVERKLGRLQGATDRIAGGFKSVGDSATQLGKKMLPASAIVSGAAIGMFALAKNTADAGDEIAKSARAAGVSSDALQELRFALGQAAGVGEAETSTMLSTLTRRMGEAVAGNDTYADALGNLGVSLEDVASGAVTTDEVFTRLADAMQDADSNSEAAALGMELLGRAGATLGGKLRESGADIGDLRDRAQELGIVLGSDTLNSAEQFTDKMDELSQQTGAAKSAIGAALLPVALELATAFQERVVPAIVAVAEGIGDAIEWFGQLPGPVQEAAGLVAAAIGVGGPVLLAVGAMSKAFGAIIAATGPIGLFIAAAGLLYAAWQKWGDDIIVVVGEAVEFIRTKFNELVEWLAALPERMFEIGMNIIHGLRDGIRDAWEGAKESISGAFSGVVDTARGIFRTQSPSLVFHEIGMNIGEGLRNGIQDSFGMVRSAVQGLGQQVTSGAFDMASGVVDAMGQMFQGSKPIAAAQALINTFQGITEALKLPFPASLAAAARVAAQGFAAVRGIQSARPGSSGGISRTSGGSGGSGATTSAQQQAPTTTFQFTLQNDPMGFGEQFARQFIEQLNEASANGGQIRGVIA